MVFANLVCREVVQSVFFLIEKRKPLISKFSSQPLDIILPCVVHLCT